MRFNESVLDPAIDFAVHQVFRTSLGEDNSRVLVTRMKAIDILFHAGLHEKDRRIKEVAEGEFGKHYWTLVEHDREDPFKLSDDVAKKFGKTLSILTESLRKTSSYSAFVSKLLHWSFPQAFPMTDSRARNAISRLAKNNCSLREKLGHNWSQTLFKGKAEHVRNYEGVIAFYRWLEGTLGESYLEQIRLKDLETLPKSLRPEQAYSWLRVVDKWLWLKGGPTAEA